MKEKITSSLVIFYLRSKQLYQCTSVEDLLCMVVLAMALSGGLTCLEGL